MHGGLKGVAIPGRTRWYSTMFRPRALPEAQAVEQCYQLARLKDCEFSLVDTARLAARGESISLASSATREPALKVGRTILTRFLVENTGYL